MDFENSIVHFPATHRHLTFVNILIPKQFRNPKRNTDKGENFSAVQGRIRTLPKSTWLVSGRNQQPVWSASLLTNGAQSFSPVSSHSVQR